MHASPDPPPERPLSPPVVKRPPPPVVKRPPPPEEPMSVPTTEYWRVQVENWFNRQVTRDGLEQLIERGIVTRDTLVRRDSDRLFSQAGSFGELFPAQRTSADEEAINDEVVQPPSPALQRELLNSIDHRLQDLNRNVIIVGILLVIAVLYVIWMARKLAFLLSLGGMIS